MNNVETVFVPHGLTAQRIESLRVEIMRKFYFNPRFLWSWSRRLIRRHGWKEMVGRSGLYARFFRNTLAELVTGLGRGA